MDKNNSLLNKNFEVSRKDSKFMKLSRRRNFCKMLICRALGFFQNIYINFDDCLYSAEIEQIQDLINKLEQLVSEWKLYHPDRNKK